MCVGARRRRSLFSSTLGRRRGVGRRACVCGGAGVGVHGGPTRRKLWACIALHNELFMLRRLAVLLFVIRHGGPTLYHWD